MASQKIIPAMKGEQASFVFFQDNVKKSFPFKSWNVKPNVTKHADGVNGEKRDRLDKTLNYYEFSGEMFMVDAEVLDAHLADLEPYDDNVAPLDQKGAVRLEPRDGTRRSFVCQNMILDDFDMKQGGRNEKLMTTVTGRFTNLKAGKSA